MSDRRGVLATVVSVFACALALTLPAYSLAAGGEFTQAESNAGWTQGSLAGSVTWTGCENAVAPPVEGPENPGEGGKSTTPLAPESPYCGWTPYVTVGPGTGPAECDSAERQLGSLGPEVGLVWSERRKAGHRLGELRSTERRSRWSARTARLSLRARSRTDRQGAPLCAAGRTGAARLALPIRECRLPPRARLCPSCARRTIDCGDSPPSRLVQGQAGTSQDAPSARP